MARMKQLMGDQGPEQDLGGMNGDPSGVLKQMDTSGMMGAGQQEAPGFALPQRRTPADSGIVGGQSGSTPRENFDTNSMNGVQTAMRRPSSPTPMAGSGSVAPGANGGQGVMPFEPMGSPDVSSLTSPVGGGLLGKAGGLKGGGLGVPMDPTSNQQSDPISGLIQQLLMKSKGGMF